jgi:RNA polymerase sigma-70 factor (ECF subfamily)
MLRSAAGELTAFELLVKKFQHPLVNFFRRMGVSMDEAEDLTQETFIRLYEYRKRYRRRARFNTFLFRLARHVLIDHQRRKRKRARPSVQRALLQMATQTGSAQSGFEQEMHWALQQLPEKNRLVVVLGCLLEFKYKEIAEILGVPLGTVQSRMHYGLRKLREILKRE